MTTTAGSDCRLFALFWFTGVAFTTGGGGGEVGFLAGLGVTAGGGEFGFGVTN